MKFFNICSKRIIHSKKGTKTLIYRVGVLKVSDSGKWFVQLFQYPNVDYQVFAQEEQELPVIEA